MSRNLSAAVLLAALMPFCAAAAADDSIVITVYADRPGIAIKSNFIGLSFEKSVLAENHFRADNLELINLCRNLGAGVLRFGGNKVETTCWQSNATSDDLPVAKSAVTKIGPRNLENLYAFAKQVNWPVIHGLNLASNTPAAATAEAVWAMKMGGSNVLALEIGNEPDFYPKHGLRPADYTYDQYAGEFDRVARGIKAALPKASLAGPATTRHSIWFENFLADNKKRVGLTTYHFYSLSARSRDVRSPNYASVENLLSKRTKSSWEKDVSEKLKAAQAAGLPLRLGECNSVSNGGSAGVSDSFASALWGVDFLFDLASFGVDGVNFHGAFSAHGYTPVGWKNSHYHACPLYYALLLFHQVAPGRMLPVDFQTSRNLAAYAVQGDNHKLRVILINKELQMSVSVFVAAGKRAAHASLIRLAAPSIDSKESISLAGQAVGGDGNWLPGSGEVITASKGHFGVCLPAASVALLTIE
jgi:Glycosyl hydrolase family 79 C-terminal beta domain